MAGYKEEACQYCLTLKHDEKNEKLIKKLGVCGAERPSIVKSTLEAYFKEKPLG